MRYRTVTYPDGHVELQFKVIWWHTVMVHYDDVFSEPQRFNSEAEAVDWVLSRRIRIAPVIGKEFEVK